MAMYILISVIVFTSFPSSCRSNRNSTFLLALLDHYSTVIQSLLAHGKQSRPCVDDFFQLIAQVFLEKVNNDKFSSINNLRMSSFILLPYDLFN